MRAGHKRAYGCPRPWLKEAQESYVKIKPEISTYIFLRRQLFQGTQKVSALMSAKAHFATVQKTLNSTPYRLDSSKRRLVLTWLHYPKSA